MTFAQPNETAVANSTSEIKDLENGRGGSAGYGSFTGIREEQLMSPSTYSPLMARSTCYEHYRTKRGGGWSGLLRGLMCNILSGTAAQIPFYFLARDLFQVFQF